MTQREIGHLEKSILIPLVSREILDYKTQPELFRDDAIESTRGSNAERTIHGHLACHITGCDPFNEDPTPRCDSLYHVLHEMLPDLAIAGNRLLNLSNELVPKLTRSPYLRLEMGA